MVLKENQRATQKSYVFEGGSISNLMDLPLGCHKFWLTAHHFFFEWMK